MGKNQHVVPRGEHGWAVLGAGNQRDTSHHPTQEEARLAAREIAMNQKSEAWFTASTDKSVRRTPTATIPSRREAE